MQVKEYIQTLVDEKKIRMERIGSGNWYWSFASDEVQARETELGCLRRELERSEAAWREIGGRLTALREKRNMEEGDGNVEEARNGLMRAKGDLEREVGMLRSRMEETKRGQGRKSVAAMKAEIGELKEQAHMWTDNVYILEQYVRKLAGGDREVVKAIQQECYGEEYTEEDGGLRELLLPLS